MPPVAREAPWPGREWATTPISRGLLRHELVHWVRRVPLIGDGEIYIDPNSVDRKIYQRWTWHTDVTSDNNNASLQVGYYLNLARTKTT